MDSETPQQLGYGHLRFRSAPGSLLDSFAESGRGKGSPTTESIEEDKFRLRFMGFSSGDVLEEKPRGSPTANSPRGYTGLPPQYPRVSSGLSSSSAMDGSYLGVGSLGMDHLNQPKLNSSNLSRQNSTPPGLFTQLSSQNGYAAVKGSGNHRVGSGFEGELSPKNRLKGQFNFQSSVGMLSQISEIGGESMGDGVREDSIRIGIGGNASQYLGSGFHFNSWNNTPHFSDNLAGLKRERDDDMRLFPSSQNCELGNRGPILSHHLSLPRSSSEFPTMEKFLQFQDSVPCKIRAKRGCATHPRSIAERVRRTRISERMRKLQELVPNMDKQTNTADMLDLAVDYINDLQKQFKTLNDVRAKCRCLNQQASMTNQMI